MREVDLNKKQLLADVRCCRLGGLGEQASLGWDALTELIGVWQGWVSKIKHGCFDNAKNRGYPPMPCSRGEDLDV